MFLYGLESSELNAIWDSLYEERFIRFIDFLFYNWKSYRFIRYITLTHLRKFFFINAITPTTSRHSYVPSTFFKNKVALTLYTRSSNRF